VDLEAGAHLMKIISTITVATYHILKGGMLVIREGSLKNKQYVLSQEITGNYHPIIITTYEYALPSGDLVQAQALTRENTKTSWMYEVPSDKALIELLRRAPNKHLSALVQPLDQ
jgi:hypothetical protein